MRRRSGHIGAVAAAILLALTAIPGPALAAESLPGGGVAFEATLTVRFTDAVTLLPVDAAAVHVIARQGDAVVGEYDGTTDADGTAVLTGLPIETGEGPAVRLGVVADKSTTSEDPGSGCSLAATWHAERADVAVDAVAVDVAFDATEQDSASSISCPGTQPTGEVAAVSGTSGITLPATDAAVPTTTSTSDPGAALVVGFIFALAGLSLVLRRPRRGDG